MAEIQGDACKTIISWHESPRNGCWKKKGRPLTEEKIKIDTLLYVLLATHLSFSRTTGQPFGTLRNFIARTRYVFTAVVFNILISFTATMEREPSLRFEEIRMKTSRPRQSGPQFLLLTGHLWKIFDVELPFPCKVYPS
jgi:hypothetical protein